MINISINTSPNFHDGTSEGNLMIVNDGVNRYPYAVEITCIKVKVTSVASRTLVTFTLFICSFVLLNAYLYSYINMLVSKYSEHFVFHPYRRHKIFQSIRRTKQSYIHYH